MIFEKVRKILADQFSVNEDDITLETHIVDDLNADSLDVVDLIMTIEEEFGIEILDKDIENVTTVDSLVTYLKKKI